MTERTDGGGGPASREDLFASSNGATKLKERSAASGLIAVSGRAVQIALRLVSVAILARLLTPGDFGVRALVLPVIILTNSVINLRLNVAALQQPNLDSEGLGRVFRLSMRFNLLIVVIIATLGPLLAQIYQDSRVIGVTAAWAAAIYVLNFGAFHEALLKRQMRFGVTVSIETLAMFIGMIVAIIAASLGAGYWALVIEIGVIGIARSLGAWLACPWRPPPATPGVPDERVNEMLSFGRNLTGFRVLQWISTQTDRVLVGLFGAHTLGLYDGARRWGWLSTVELDSAIREVAVSSFSRAQEQPAQLRRLVRGATSAMLFLSLPISAFLFIEAEGAVRILFGDAWLGAVPFVEYMCFGAFFAALSRPTGWIFESLGRTRRQFRWGVLETVVIFGSLLVGSIAGPMGIAAGYAASHAFLAFPTIWFCLRGTSVTLLDYLGAALRPAVAAAVGGLVAVGTIRLFGDIGTPARMTIEFAVFTTVYLLAWVLQPGGRRAARDGIALLRELGRGVGARLRGTAPPTEASVTGD